MWRQFLRVLRELEPNRHFLKLWASQALSLTAFNMVNFTLLIRVYSLTHSSLLVSLFVLSFGLPSLLFGAVAGEFADRWSRRGVLVTTNAIRTGVVLLFLPALSHLPTIYLVTFLIAGVTQFFTPAEAALIPELVEKKHLLSANAIFMMTLFISFIVGYGIAGPLAATGGDSLPIIVASVMFGLATVSCARLPAKGVSRPNEVAVKQAYRSVLSGLKEGFAAVRASGPVRYAIGQLTVLWATIGVVMVVLPAFTSKVLDLNTREVSRAIIVPIGFGMISGGFLLPILKRRLRPRIMVTSLLLLAGACVALLGQINVWMPEVVAHLLRGIITADNAQQLGTALLAVVLGAAISVVMIANQTLLHEETPPALRGRVFGVLGTSINAANTVPVLLAGVITDVLSVATAVSLTGVLLAVWAVYSLRVGRPRVDTAS